MRSSVDLVTQAEIKGQRVERCLRLIWQDEETRQFIHVGVLWELLPLAFAFEYSDGARHPRFAPLPEFPDLERLYSTDRLPAFFANRVMSPHRRSFGAYADWLGVGDVPTPVEILARSGGRRSTDTFHVVEGFVPIHGRIEGSFFASGVRHIPGAKDRLLRMSSGDFLTLRREPSNPVNPLAVLLDAEPSQPVGYVPDWLLTDLKQLNLEQTSVRVERVNRDAPAHLQLLCRLSGEVLTP